MHNQFCKECFYFDVFETTRIQTNLAGIPEATNMMGYCRKRSPRVVSEDKHVATRFPAVDGEKDWCGKFSRSC